MAFFLLGWFEKITISEVSRTAVMPWRQFFGTNVKKALRLFNDVFSWLPEALANEKHQRSSFCHGFYFWVIQYITEANCQPEFAQIRIQLWIQTLEALSEKWGLTLKICHQPYRWGCTGLNHVIVILEEIDTKLKFLSS